MIAECVALLMFINGEIKKLLGGHFSCRVSKLQQRWHPCEGEALAARVVLQHFSGYIRESKNQIQILILA